MLKRCDRPAALLGPIGGPYFRFLTTFVRAAGRGSVSDPERLEQELAVALPNHDITIDVTEVEELGPDGIEALARAEPPPPPAGRA
jgi:hypothetical protein